MLGYVGLAYHVTFTCGLLVCSVCDNVTSFIWVFVTVRRRKVGPKPTPTVARFVISRRPMRCWRLLEYLRGV